MKTNKNAFSLVIAMWIVLVSSLLAYTIIEFMLPFSRNIKWIENATRAYYQANSWLEQGLYFFKSRWDKYIREDLGIAWSALTSYQINTFSSDSILPKKDYGTSEYDNDYNTISMWDPIQISVWNNFVKNLPHLQIQFRVPQTLGWNLDNNTWYASWQLTSGSGALNSHSGSVIKWDKINNTTLIKIADLLWISYSHIWGDEVWNIEVKDIFEWDTLHGEAGKEVRKLDCKNEDQKCILKFSVINKLESSLGKSIPYLEWKIRSVRPNPDTLPLRYSIIESTWKSYNFGRKLEIKYPQDTVNQAFDFTVFQ